MDELKRLVENRAKAFERMKEISDKAAAEENRSLTAEEEQEWNRCNTEIEESDKKIERLERQEEIEKRNQELSQRKEEVPQPNGDGEQTRTTYAEHGRNSDEYHDAFTEFLKRGASGLSQQNRSTLQVDLDTGGGFIVASQRFINKLIQDLDDLLIIRKLATVYPASYEESLGFPTLDGDISSFDWGAGELTEADEDTGIAFGRRELKPRPLKRKVIKISRRLLESKRLDAEALVRDRGKIALAETFEEAYMTGNGADRPLGMFVASDVGIPASRDNTTNSSTFLVADDLMDAQDTLKAGYKGVWIFHRNAITRIRKLKDGNGQYIWQPGLQVKEPNRILGDPYYTGDKVPNTFTASQYVGMYGDLKYYWIADATSLQIQRLVEKYALTGQVGLLFDRMASDAMPVKAEAFVRLKSAA